MLRLCLLGVVISLLNQRRKELGKGREYVRGERDGREGSGGGRERVNVENFNFVCTISSTSYHKIKNYWFFA